MVRMGMVAATCLMVQAGPVLAQPADTTSQVSCAKQSTGCSTSEKVYPGDDRSVRRSILLTLRGPSAPEARTHRRDQGQGLADDRVADGAPEAAFDHRLVEMGERPLDAWPRP